MKIFSHELSEVKDPDDSAAHFLGIQEDPMLVFHEDTTSPAPAALTQPETSETQLSKDDGTKRPNVVLSSDRKNQALPEGLVNIGNVGIVLPDPATQGKGFYLKPDDAAVLVAQFRQFKFLVNKGQATPPVKIGE